MIYDAFCKPNNSSNCRTEVGLSEQLQVLQNILSALGIKKGICVSLTYFEIVKVYAIQTAAAFEERGEIFINTTAMPPFLLRCRTFESQRNYICLPEQKILC